MSFPFSKYPFSSFLLLRVKDKMSLLKGGGKRKCGISRDLLKKKGVKRDLGGIFYSPFSSEVFSMGKGAFSIHRLAERILMLKNPEKKHYQVSFRVFL